MSEIDNRAPLLDHLTELRSRIIKCAYAIFIFSVVGWFLSGHIFDLMRHPIEPYLTSTGGGLVFTDPTAKFVAYLHIAVYFGFVAAGPFWLYQIWQFVAPGLYAHEKKYAVGFIASGTILFLTGVCFVYFLVFPAAFKFLLHFGGEVDKPMITIDGYLSFILKTTLVFGLAFELPLLLVLLGLIGIIDDKSLRKNRRYAIVILSIVAAIVTPPDVLSMLSLLAPLILLYEISILIVAGFVRKRQNALKTS